VDVTATTGIARVAEPAHSVPIPLATVGGVRATVVASSQVVADVRAFERSFHSENVADESSVIAL
jgi:hypothetical protein